MKNFFSYHHKRPVETHVPAQENSYLEKGGDPAWYQVKKAFLIHPEYIFSTLKKDFEETLVSSSSEFIRKFQAQ